MAQILFNCPDVLKAELRKYKQEINVSEVCRRALSSELKKVKGHQQPEAISESLETEDGEFSGNL